MKVFKKVQVGNVHEKAQSERNSHSKKRGGKVYMGNSLALTSGKHVREMCTPSYPVLYSKTWVYSGIPIFIILLQNINCGFSLEPPRRVRVPTIYVLSIIIKNIKTFLMKFSTSTAETKIFC